MKTRTVWLTETVTYRMAVDVETEDDNEAVEKAQKLWENLPADEVNHYFYDCESVDWYVEPL